jgi:flagellar hook-associated protein 1 FlgK
VSEVEVFLQETDGEAFQSALSDLYEAFSEFSKDPSDAVNQNLVMQKSSLFLSRTQGVDQGLRDYQATINQKIIDDVDRINELGKQISELNKSIQRIESAGIETAMDLRDTRDLCLDELATLAKISYKETNDGVVKVQLEGVEFVSEARSETIGLERDALTGFVTPYWNQLSDLEREDYYPVFDLSNIESSKNTDIGEVKALLLARGDHYATYLDMEGLSSEEYSSGLANSVMMNTESEIDRLAHNMITAINNVLCPNKTYDGTATTGTDAYGNVYTIDDTVQILDVDNAAVGSDGELPPQELFSRNGCDRYTRLTLQDGSTVYLYNEEDPKDTSKCYTIRSIHINDALVENESLLPHKMQNGLIDYNLGAKIEAIWDEDSYTLNPNDDTPASFTEFYTKLIGEIGTTGSVYSSTADSLQNTADTIESNRQAVVGVSSDEELTNMIKYQAGYNAASRYINVINEMIEYLLTSL